MGEENSREKYSERKTDIHRGFVSALDGVGLGLLSEFLSLLVDCGRGLKMKHGMVSFALASSGLKQRLLSNTLEDPSLLSC